MSRDNSKNPAFVWWRESDRLERLEALWSDRSVSASKIALILGTTKSAVIGMAHRQRLGFRDPNHKPPTATSSPNPIERLKPNDCRWPIGHPGQAGFHFCGAEALGSGPYCGPHGKVAYVRPTTET